MSRKSKSAKPEPIPQPPVRRIHRGLIILSAGLLLLVILVFQQLSSYDFIDFDDPGFVSNNVVVQAGLSWPGLLYAFESYDQGSLHPLTWISHMATVELFGLDPGWHHIVNIAIHGVNTVLLLLFLYRLTGALGRSALVTAVFAVHPMHVEVVAWIAQRKELLAMVFCLLTLLAWLEWVRSGARRWYWIAVGMFVLGLMSKPTIVPLPMLLLLLDWWPLRRLAGWRGAWPKFVEKWPFWAVSVAFGILTYIGQRAVGAMEALGKVSFLTHLMSVPDNYAFYLWRTFWPVRLAPHYEFSGHVPWSAFAIGLAVVGAITALVLWQGQRRRYLVVGWFWFLFAIAPMAGLVYAGGSIRSDRFTYLAHVGLALLIVWGLHELLGDRHKHVLVRGLVGLLFVALAARAWNQTTYWRDSYTLFRHTLEVTENNAVANHVVAKALENAKRIDEAMPYIEKAIQISPDYGQALLTKARLELAAQKAERALATLDRALRIVPDSASAHFDRALVLEELRREDECRTAFQKALDLRLAPAQRPRALFGIGRSLMRVHREPAAAEYFLKALALDPYYYMARKNLGYALVSMGKYVEALNQFESLSTLSGNSTDADVQQALRYLNTVVKR
jgi:tetratricopeptide (TPR) repeat protein